MISTHILDLNLGQPASGVDVHLEKLAGSEWKSLKKTTTDQDGRIIFSIDAEKGTFRLSFEIANYFKTLGQTPFFIMAPVVFQVEDSNRKYHIPLLLSPFGYSTYRGS